MEAFDKLGLDLASMLLPWIAILISISAAFWFKDFATNPLNNGKADIDIAPIMVHTAVIGIYLNNPPSSEALHVPTL